MARAVTEVTPVYISTTRNGPFGLWGYMLIVFGNGTCIDSGFPTYNEAVYVDYFLRGYYGWYD